MRRVVFVNRYFFPDHSATSQMLSDLAFHLAAAGWPVLVLTSRQRYDDPRAGLPKREEIRGVEVRRVWTTRFGRSNLLLRSFDYATFYASAFLALTRSDRRDIVVAKTDPPLLSVVAAAACSVTDAPLVNWIQDLFPEVAEQLGTLRRGAVTNLLRRLRNWSLRRATMNVVIGRRMADLLQSIGITSRVRENWADGAGIVPRDRKENRLRREWGLDSAFVVGYSGNLGRAHEFQTMLRAMEELRDQQTIRFLIIGDGPRLDTVQRFAAERGLDNVLFKPYQPREMLSESLGAADVHLVSLEPSVEGLIVPSKFYGIAAAGRPSIYIGDAGGEIAMILVRNDCGFHVQPGNPQALSAVISQLAADPDRAEMMGKNARRLFERQYDSRIALLDWQNILEAVA